MTPRNRGQKIPLLGKINIVLLVVAAVIMLFSYVDTHEVLENTYTQRIEPSSVAVLEDGSKEYFFNISDYDYHYTGIVFYTAHQIVEAYSKGVEIYSFDKTGGFWGSTTGSKYHFIQFNDKMTNIAVIVKPVYQQVANQRLDFYIGSAYQMYDEIMAQSMPRFFVSLLIVFLSIAILLYYFFMHIKQHLSKELLFLGYFSFFAGIWSINETDVGALLTKNKIVDSLVPYLCLMLMVPPFILFFDSYLDLHGKIVKEFLLFISTAQFIVLTALHFLKIVEYRESLIVMQVMLLVVGLYMGGGMIVQLVKRNITRHVQICAVGLSLFLLTLLVDIGQYYRELGDADRIGRYVFLIFIFMIAWDMIKDANEIIEKGRRAKQLEVFALTDSMTGLFNRNAFESHAKAESKLDGLIAVVADANGLKQCNDTYGHEAGDEYITAVADIFSSVYGKYGNCYRTGGDEFCCIIPANRNVNTERLKKLFYTKVYTANLEGNHKFSIGVAIGDARYDSELDRDFRGLVKRADASMYENKRASKSS